MKYNNYDIKAAYYSGYTITSAYGCGGYKVFDGGDVPPTPTGGTKFYAEYNGGQQVYSAKCSSNTSLTTATTKPSGYEYSAMTSAIIGDCITSIGSDAFFQCESLTSCTIGSGVTSIGFESFYACKSLPSITIPDSVTTIDNRAFQWCTGLTSCNIGSGVTSIGIEAFRYCNSLTSVTIPNNVTTIRDLTFDECYSLTSITIPNSVTSIGLEAFYDCSGLTSIVVKATTPPTLGNDVFVHTNNCPIYVPAESVNLYKQADGWSEYANRIFTIT